jgi:hypothetical protein
VLLVATVMVAAVLGIVVAYPTLGPPASSFLVVTWIGAALAASAVALKPLVNGIDTWWRSPWLSFVLQAAAALWTLRAWAQEGPGVTPLGAVGVLSAQGARMILVVLGLCAMLCLVYQGAFRLLLRKLASRDRARGAAETAGHGLAWSFLGLWFVTAFLLTIALEGRLDDTWLPLRKYQLEYLPFVLRDALRFTLAFWVLVTALLLFVSAVWVFAPSAVAEVSDMSEESPSRVTLLTAPRVEEAQRQGEWLARGQRVLSALAKRAWLLLVLIPLSWPLALHHRVGSLLDPVNLRFWGVVLPAGLAGLALLARSPAVLAGAWPLLGPILDFDTYLRRPASAEKSARANILARGLTLLAHVGEHRTDSGDGYASLLLVGHSQGSVIAVDLLRGALDQVKPSPSPPAIILVTMGSPLRQVHAALLPHRFGWVLEPSAGSYLPRIVSRWTNLFTAGDYLGRSLWREPPGTYGKETWRGPNEQPQREERCIGPGAHLGYLHNCEVGRELLEQLRHAP